MKTKEERLLAIENEAKLLREEIEAESKPEWEIGDCFKWPGVPGSPRMIIYWRGHGNVTIDSCGVTMNYGPHPSITELMGVYPSAIKIPLQEWLDARSEQ